MPSKLRDSLWDDSEPLYAPFMKRIKDKYRWIPSQRYRDAGYAIKSMLLAAQGDTDTDARKRAAQCRELTRELMTWWNGETEPRIKEGTWGWLIQRYLTDEYSPFHEVRPKTKESYREQLAIISDAIADVPIADTDFQMMMEWRGHMQKNGRSTAYVKRWFTHFGLAIAHGVRLKVPGCAEVKAIRSEMRIKNPVRKSTYATRAQIDAIVKQSDIRGFNMLAVSLLFRFEFLLRGVDVYGQWVTSDNRTGGIQHEGRIWEGGLTWDMFDPDLSGFEKVISKTRDSLPEPYYFDLTNVPEIRHRLLKVPSDKRFGPVIVCKDGMPPKHHLMTRQFAKVRKDLKLPTGLKLMDARASGITEAKGMVDPFQLRDASQHTQVSTTDRYVRARSDAANNVVKIRRENNS